MSGESAFDTYPARYFLVNRCPSHNDSRIRKTTEAASFLAASVIWLGYRDSNPNYLIQSQASYR